ncbi:MAG: cytochrome c [Paracoccaceae bacterium]|nr:cytochrome c [Paracoccaceae bacterium]MDE3121276.1 cytochrome c [Paracoccaceae bacterium]MDE3239832.1 cytochrome c [Paracoccaceae bacterium]
MKVYTKAAVILGGLALSATTAFAASTTVTGDAHAGHHIFLTHCAVCHKTDASGGVKLGDTKSADLQSPGLEDQYHKDDALIKRAILTGKDEEGGDLDKIMPRWKGKLTDQQVNDVIAYLHTVKTHE